jgi:hypothetical protein
VVDAEAEGVLDGSFESFYGDAFCPIALGVEEIVNEVVIEPGLIGSNSVFGGLHSQILIYFSLATWSFVRYSRLT